MGALRGGLQLPACKGAAPPSFREAAAGSPPRGLLGGVVSLSEEPLRG